MAPHNRFLGDGGVSIVSDSFVLTDDPDGPCECAHKHPELYEGGERIHTCGDESPDGLRCTRPEGHDGPHSGCNIGSHPVDVWGQDDGA